MTQPSQPAQIQEKESKPAGLLPKNVQSWLLLGLAFLMLAIMWLTGGKKTPAPAKAAPSSAPPEAPLEVNQAKINDLQNRIADLQRQQMVAQNALAQQTRLFSGSSPEALQNQPQTSASGISEPRPEDPIQAEKKNRAYLSLFASNVALTYRNNPAVAAGMEGATPPALPGPVPSQPESQAAAILPNLALEDSHVPVAPTLLPAQSDSATSTHQPKEEPKKPSVKPSVSGNPAEGKTYILFEGTLLESVLINRLDGGFAGPVECLLSTDVYSNDRQHLLIPAGSKLLGQTKKVDTFGQTRLAVVFHRLLMPDGYSVSLDQFQGLNQFGDSGLRDQVNNHYARIFGVSLAVGALGAAAEAGTAGSLTASGADLMRQGFGQSTAQSAAQILDRFLNVMPTVTIREGHRVEVYLSGDLALPDYHNHKLPSDL
ncbi:MAG: TrbI/VirB10 family protein [Candidatus Acidiferrum sp.]